MKVNFYATLRQVVGGKTIEIPVAQGMTLRELIDEIIARYPRLRSELLDETGNLYRHVHVFVNGRDAPHLDDGLETKIAPEDTVDFFPAVAGGTATSSSAFEDALVGIPLWLLQEYLEHLGGKTEPDGWLHGQGWRAHLTQIEDYCLGSLRVGRVRLKLQGNAGSVEEVRQALKKKLLRAGG